MAQTLNNPIKPVFNITNKAETPNYKMSPTFSGGGWNQLSCLSLTRSAVCCPPLDAISTARFSSCFPVIFTGLNSSSSSPVPSCRFVPIPQAYTDPGIKTKKNTSSIQATDKQSNRQKKPHSLLTFSGDSKADRCSARHVAGRLYSRDKGGLCFLLGALAQTKTAVFCPAQTVHLS